MPLASTRLHAGARTRSTGTGAGASTAAAAGSGAAAASIADDPVAAATLQDMEVALRSAYTRSLRRPGSLNWRSRYQLAAFLVDLAAAVLAVVGAFVARFGYDAANLELGNLALLAILPAAWLMSVCLNRAYEVRVLGAGATEFERIGKAFLHLTAVTTFAAYATHADLSRGFVLLALPTTLVLSGLGRYALRKAVHRGRKSGRATVPVLAVGGAEEIAAFSDTLLRNGHAGLRVTAACLVPGNVPTPEAAAALAERGIPVAGDVDSIRDTVLETGASTVAVIAHRISGEKLRWISWQLEGTDADLALMPGLTEVAGRRLSIQQVGELPLLYVAEPEFTGLRRVIKGAFDRAVALLALIVLAPLLLGIAATVRLTSRGPALFLQTRVGKDGKTFRMVKFRSMVADAEDHVDDLSTLNEVAGGTLFKIRHDPRVTQVGRILRRFSLDEVPQLLNVVTGSMSLVGPRPPLPSEVATYGGVVRRRLLVKPGMTGLWQISGRSDLTWEESVRIDLRYVENWSLSLDLLVILKTARAVLRAEGAY